MSKPVFLSRGDGLALDAVIEMTGARPRRNDSAQRRVFDVAPLDRAGPYDIGFADGDDDAAALATTQAAACFVREPQAKFVPERVQALVVDDPYKAFVIVAAALFPDASRPSSLFDVTGGAAANATVHSSARLEAGVTIDPAAVIGPRTEIGGGTLIGPLAVIGPGVRIGRNCAVGAGASVTNALVGDRVVIQPGARIGDCGITFGREASSRGEEPPQVGRVIIQDGVRVGANAAISRGDLRDTIIGEGTRVENLVQIGGDVIIGRHCVVGRVSTLSDLSLTPVGPMVPDNARIVDVQLSA
jgi:UDP-3-O-[3-hydroxymyristoyl] glucosamine N-acyltransferase